MKRILCSLLVGCLVFCLAGCDGDATTTANIEQTQSESKTSNGETSNEVKDVDEDVVEEVVSVVWSEELSEMFKPAFEIHPILKGEVVVAGTYENMVSLLGEPVVSEDGWWQFYNITNTAGVAIDAAFRYEESMGKVTVLKHYNTTDEFFVTDNEYYLITEDLYWEFRVARNGESQEEVNELTYNDIVEIFGTPGFITHIYTDADGTIRDIEIMWVYPSAEDPSDYTYAMITFKPDGYVDSYFGTTNVHKDI